MIDLTTLAIALSVSGTGGGSGSGGTINTLTIQYIFESYAELEAYKEDPSIPTGSLAVVVSGENQPYNNQVFIKQEEDWAYLFKMTEDFSNLENLIWVAKEAPKPIPANPKIWLDTTSEGIRVPTAEALEELEQELANEIQRAMTEEAQIRGKIEGTGEGGGGLGTSYVTPEYYGAIGNGEQDDTQAIQQAVASGLPVHFLNDYKITSTINITAEGCSLLGGKVGTIHYTGDANCFHVTSNFTTISGLHIIGNGLNEAFFYDYSNWNSLDHVSMINIDGIKVLHGSGNKFSDFNISDAQGTGVYVAYGDDNHFDNATITMNNFIGTCAELHDFAKNVTFENCHFTHGYNGIVFSTNTTGNSVSDFIEKVPTNCKFTACHFDSCLKAGATINDAQNISFNDCFFSCRPDTGAQVGGRASHILFSGCQFHFNHIGLRIGGNSEFVKATDCSFDTNGSLWITPDDKRMNLDQAMDIHISNTPKNFIINGCSFSNNLFGDKFYNNTKSATHISVNQPTGVTRAIISNNIFSNDTTWKVTNNLDYISGLQLVNNIGI